MSAPKQTRRLASTTGAILALVLSLQVGLVAPRPARAQWARLLLDIRGTDHGVGDARDARLGDHLLFPGVDGVPYDLFPGLAIWRTNGTPEGTYIGAAESLDGIWEVSYWSWGIGDSYVVFHTESETWRSDGTEDGTFWLGNVTPCRPGTGGSRNQYARLGDEVFFCGWGWDSDPEANFELWKTDGTVAGTRLVKDIYPASRSVPWDLTEVNGTLFFTASGETTGRELWKSDGTEAGTLLVKDIEPGPGPSEPHSLTGLGGSLYFLTLAGPEGLWKSDGTEAGTILVKAADGNFERPDALTAVGAQLFFVTDGASHGQELWKSDGTPRGTVFVRDINPADPACLGYDSYSPPLVREPIASLGDVAFFRADDGVHGCELWKSDGTPSGTSLVNDINLLGSSWPEDFYEANGYLYFRGDDGEHGLELWRTDGTEEGTVLVHDINPLNGSSYPRIMGVLGDSIIVRAMEPAHGSELWRTDGTSAGTWMIRDTNTHPRGSYPYSLTPSGRDLFFGADDGVGGRELWRSDGSESGTVIVQSLPPGYWSDPLDLTDVQGELFFTGGVAAVGRSLWKSDGTEAGTHVVRHFGDDLDAELSYPSHLTAVGDLLFFRAWPRGSPPPLEQYELWKSDGTEAGTVPLVRGNDISELTALGDLLLFRGHGEIWRSDGTEEGTRMVSDIHPERASEPTGLAAMGDWLYFSADDGVHGRELWRSNGDAAGTTLVRDIQPDGSSSPRDLTACADRLFFVADDGASGEELWQSDGSAQGTSRVRDIHPIGSSSPDQLLDAGGLLYFLADDGIHGSELWVSDGSEAGTRLVKDINSGAEGCSCSLGAVFDGRLFFGAEDGIHGRELWTSDGTEVGTWMLQDLRPGDESSGAYASATLDELVFLTADDGLHGRELWVGEAWTEPRSLSLALHGTGSGLVTSVPAGLHCGADCEGLYPFATAVRMSADPADGSWFAGWGGDDDCLDGTVIMLLPRSCTARFDLCEGPPEIQLMNETISDERSVTACNRLLVGPAWRLTATADVTLEAGESVALLTDVAIEAGALLRVTTGSP